METFDYFNYEIDCIVNTVRGPEGARDEIKKYVDDVLKKFHEKYLQVLEKNAKSFGMEAMVEIRTPSVDLCNMLKIKLNMAIANEIGRRTGRETLHSSDFVRVNIVKDRSIQTMVAVMHDEYNRNELRKWGYKPKPSINYQ